MCKKINRFLPILFILFIIFIIGSCSEVNETVVTDASVEESISSETTVVTDVPIEESISSETTVVTDVSIEESISLETTVVTNVPIEESISYETTVVTNAPIEESISYETTVVTNAPIEESIVASDTTVLTTAKKVVETTLDSKKSEATAVSSNDASRVVLPVENIQQLPELPAGCEITATTIVMNYEGIKIDKLTLLSYLPMMQYPDENNRWASPWDVFVGNPKWSYYGCYSPVIIKTVNSVFETNEINSYEIVDLSDSSVEDLYDQIDAGHPVIVWATMFMKESYTGRSSWTLQDGTVFNWRSNEHCLVLIGYDKKYNTVILSDPYDEKGTVEYDADLFEKRYEELERQALIIKKKEK